MAGVDQMVAELDAAASAAGESLRRAPLSRRRKLALFRRRLRDAELDEQWLAPATLKLLWRLGVQTDPFVFFTGLGAMLLFGATLVPILVGILVASELIRPGLIGLAYLSAAFLPPLVVAWAWHSHKAPAIRAQLGVETWRDFPPERAFE